MRMTKTCYCKIALLTAVLLSVVSCSSSNEEEEESNIPTTPTEIVFSYGQGTYSGVELPYRIAAINTSTDKKAALVIYLHGGSSKGNDNEKQMAEAGIDSISGYLSKSGTDAILIVPQCPTDKSWGGAMNPVIKSLIDEQVSSGKADSNRIYIFGGSMGGTGTWSLLSAYPELFAAAMPVAGNPTGCIPANVAKTPVFTVMGTDDRIMSIDTVSNFVMQMKNSGAECKYEIESGWTHETTCIESYTSARLDWVFVH